MDRGKLDPSEPIRGLGGATIGDFWAWAYSDLLTNTARGIFAEFLVGSALGVVQDVRPIGWGDFDLLHEGHKIEVKASAYVQNWYQDKPTVPSFGVAESTGWDANTNVFGTERRRPADCYVFCLYAERDRARANVLDVDKWEFYVLSTEQINHDLGNQKRVGLARIRTMTSAVGYAQLKERVDRVLLQEPH